MTAETTPYYKLRKLKRFPSTLIVWEEYDGGKAFVAFLLVIASIYFLSGFWGFLIDRNDWLHNLFAKQTNILESSPSHWWQVWKYFNPFSHFANSAIGYIDIVFRLFILLCAYCLTWTAFDPRNIEGYILGIINALIGGAYVISPIDFIPDSVPIAGTVDDTILGIGMVFVGVSGWYRTHMREVNTTTILEIVNQGNHSLALELLLKDKGLSVQEINATNNPL